jgi:hypothetical protein
LLFIDVNNMPPSSCHTKLALYADGMAVITMYLKLSLLAIYKYIADPSKPILFADDTSIIITNPIPSQFK